MFDGSTTGSRAAELLRRQEQDVHVGTDRMFVRLLAAQWVLCVIGALYLSPRTWSGTESAVHAHVWAAIGLGALVCIGPIFVALRGPGTVLSRHMLAVGQMLIGALFIHVSGGRIEAHFHVFGSLAFLSVYRDWKVLVTATTVVAVDHVVRGTLWPQSIFGVLVAAQWRWVEHVMWVSFEAVILVRACVVGRRQMRAMAKRQAELEEVRDRIEHEVDSRTQELSRANEFLRREMEQRYETQRERDVLNAELLKAQKLEAVGQLAAGIAHEINTPTQFVGDNLRFLEESFGDLVPVLQAVERIAADPGDPESLREQVTALGKTLEEADADFLLEEIPQALEQSLGGVRHVGRIVRAMKEFSHPGSDTASSVNLNEAVDSTITVCRSEWKYVAEMEVDFDENVQHVMCFPGELNQVLLNLIVNAAHAIADRREAEGSRDKGTIRVSTARIGDSVEIRIGDTGTGIPEEVRERVFDPFFTTKEVGKGTGQGLAIAHNVVVIKHRGEIGFETELGVGTTFVIRIPLECSGREAA